MPARRIAVLALCTALVFGLQIALAALPNIEVVTLLFLVYTLYFGRRTLYIIYIFAVLEGLVYGFHVWWVMYLYVWTILWAAVTLLGRRPHPAVFWAVVAAIFGLLYGLLCAVPYWIVGGYAAAFAWWVAGIPFDFIHCASNFIIVAALFYPMDRLFRSFRKKGYLS